VSLQGDTLLVLRMPCARGRAAPLAAPTQEGHVAKINEGETPFTLHRRGHEIITFPDGHTLERESLTSSDVPTTRPIIARGPR
jgi:hypothetical protein